MCSRPPWVLTFVRNAGGKFGVLRSRPGSYANLSQELFLPRSAGEVGAQRSEGPLFESSLGRRRPLRPSGTSPKNGGGKSSESYVEFCPDAEIRQPFCALGELSKSSGEPRKNQVCPHAHNPYHQVDEYEFPIAAFIGISWKHCFSVWVHRSQQAFCTRFCRRTIRHAVSHPHGENIFGSTPQAVVR